MQKRTGLDGIIRLRLDTRGQDLIEYALMAGFVAIVASAVIPGAAASISTIFSQVTSVLSAAATPGIGSPSWGAGS